MGVDIPTRILEVSVYRYLSESRWLSAKSQRYLLKADTLLNQFLKLWIGAGIRPPRVTKASQLVWLTGMMGA